VESGNGHKFLNRINDKLIPGFLSTFHFPFFTRLFPFPFPLQPSSLNNLVFLRFWDIFPAMAIKTE